ncbi:DUF2442 domain-containing protein [Methylomonas sp. DH-1]|uniref:DUF2442 domain-containing protein n=1 Tax=Methylomonas sp. (strain DH-1) TaxID=1727196 RepID=UPI0009EE3F16|nr:DUF2442 domain-containing protein [Methylomonas sp. DH-1]
MTGVEPLTAYKLRLRYADGQSFEVDLNAWIAETEALSPPKDRDLFAQAKIGFAGRTVDWIEDELDLAADNLRNPAVEQAGDIGRERIRHWLHDTGLTPPQAAEALGISCRMLIYYRDGEKPIPARSGWYAWTGKPFSPPGRLYRYIFLRPRNTRRCMLDYLQRISGLIVSIRIGFAIRSGYRMPTTQGGASFATVAPQVVSPEPTMFGAK